MEKIGWLADDLEGAAPAGEVDYRVDFAGVGSAGSGRGLLGESAAGVSVVGFMLLEGEVDEQRFADDGFAWDEAPVAAVFAVVAIVAEDEVVAGGDDELVVFDEGAHADPPVGVDLGVGALEAGEVVAEVVGRAGAIDGVGLGESVAVDVDEAAVEAKVVAGEADDALDEVKRGVDGVVEDDDVAAMDGGGGKERAGAVGGRGLLVDQEEVSDEEGGLHGFGWDAEGLHAEGDDEDRHHDEVEERLQSGEDAGLFVVRVMMMTVREMRTWRDWRLGVGAFGRELLAGGDGGLSHSATSARPAPLEWLFRLDLAIRASATRRSKARRAASCWACFLVVPSDSARAREPPDLSSMRTSTRKRF